MIWRVDSERIAKSFEGEEVRFVNLVTDAIQASMWRGGVARSEVIDNLRTKMPDGGVDIEVRASLPRNLDPEGWFETPTIWQCKATSHGSIDATALRREILGKDSAAPNLSRYVIECLQRGFAYRLILSDELSAEKVALWESTLAAAVGEVAPHAPRPRVVYAKKLADWISRFPALVARWFRSGFEGALPWGVWRDRLASVTPNFVLPEPWRDVWQNLRLHVTPGGQRGRRVLEAVRGYPGVGKSRFVCEALSDVRESVVYLDNASDARKVAAQLLVEDDVQAILVIDECSSELSDALASMLEGQAGRVRVVTIDNQGERLAAARFWIEKLPEAELLKIVAANFEEQHLEAEQQQRYVSLAKGYVRLVADLCHNAPEIELNGTPVDGLSLYLRARLKGFPDRLDALLALSLVPLLGDERSGGAPEEDIASLSRAVGRFTPAVLRDELLRLNQTTGFVWAHPRGIFYVTPDVVAETAFAMAWERWVEADLEGFLSRLDESLVDRFQRRVERHGSEEVRRRIAEFFRRHIATLTLAELDAPDNLQRLARLARMAPEHYTAEIGRMLRSVSAAEIMALPSESHLPWRDPRGTLLELLSEFAQHAAIFDDVERSLRSLALAEIIVGGTDRANREWAALFAIGGSGTPLPFDRRFMVLAQMIRSGSAEERRLALRGLGESLDARSQAYTLRGRRTHGDGVPVSWWPRDAEEHRRCILEALALTREALTDTSMAAATLQLVVNRARALTRDGLLDEVKAILSPLALTDGQLTQLLEDLGECLHHDEIAPETYRTQIQSWIHELTQANRMSRVVAVVGREPFRVNRRAEKDAWSAEIDALAAELLADSAWFDAAWSFIGSPAARAGGRLGDAMGTIDSNGTLLTRLANAVERNEGLSFARGYVLALVSAHPEHIPAVGDLIDRLEHSAPAVALDWSLADSATFALASRTLRIVSSGALPTLHLQRLSPLASSGDLGLEQLIEALRLAERGGGDGVAQPGVGVALLVDWIRRVNPTEREFSDEALELAERLFLAASERGTIGEMYDVGEFLNDLYERAPDRTVTMAARAMLSERLHVGNDMLVWLASMLARAPGLVVRAVGAVALKPENRARFGYGRYRSLVGLFPVDAVLAWLDGVGVEGARVFSPHLVPPSLDEHAEPKVPALTLSLLERFGDDDEVIKGFCVGSRSHRLYKGDLSQLFAREETVAERFLDHPNAGVRAWARHEVEVSRSWRAAHEVEATIAAVR